MPNTQHSTLEGNSAGSKRGPKVNFHRRRMMFGLIGKVSAVSGRRNELGRILSTGSHGMPGCLSYVVANDLSDDDTLWITELWDSESDHQASLRLPAVQDSIAQARDLIASIERVATTSPILARSPDA
jgi:quinol monooxygenase YgiN